MISTVIPMMGYCFRYLAINAVTPYIITKSTCYLQNRKIEAIREQFHQEMEALRMSKNAPALYEHNAKWDSRDLTDYASMQINGRFDLSSFASIKEILEKLWKDIAPLNPRGAVALAMLIGIFGTLALSTYFYFPISNAVFLASSPLAREGWKTLFIMAMALSTISGVTPITSLKEAGSSEKPTEEDKNYIFTTIQSFLKKTQEDAQKKDPKAARNQAQEPPPPPSIVEID